MRRWITSVLLRDNQARNKETINSHKAVTDPPTGPHPLADEALDTAAVEEYADNDEVGQLLYVSNAELDEPWIAAIQMNKVLESTAIIQVQSQQQQEQQDEQYDINKMTKLSRLCPVGELPVPITSDESVWLGNATSVTNIPKLQRLGINAVLNMAGPYALKSTTVKSFRRLGIEYCQMNAQDRDGYPVLSLHFAKAYQFIFAGNKKNDPHNRNDLQEKNTATGSKQQQQPTSVIATMFHRPQRKCVVHCVAGQNRAALVVAAAYMLHENIPVVEAVHHVRQQRGWAALENPSFQTELVAFARYHHLLGTRPTVMTT